MRSVVLITLVVLAAACDTGEATPPPGDRPDGGSGGGDVPNNGYCADVATWGSADQAIADEILVLVNQYRSSGATCGGQAKPAVPNLVSEPALLCAARVHTADMVERDYFSHTTPDGATVADRIEAAGYTWVAIAENIAGGGMTAAAIMDQWMTSTGHCNNIMDGNLEEIGIAHSGSLSTQVFATPP